MKNHILRKRLTKNVLIVFIGIIFSLYFSKLCSAQSTKPSDIYKTYIKLADNAFAAQNYAGALPFYEKANQAKPEYNYPIDKINEIKKILAAGTDTIAQLATQGKSSNTIYKKLVAQGDYALASNDYAGAMLFYEKAYQTKPDYNYATGKIDEINAMLNAMPDTKAQLLENAISKADSLYEHKNYPEAKSEYQKALLLEPSAQIPRDKLNQISLVYVDHSDLANYNVAIANGDKQLALSDFDHAILYYEAALGMHPNAKFVKNKIAEARNQQIAYKTKSEPPSVTIAASDKQIQSPKTTEITPPATITEKADAGESQLQSNQQKYDAALAYADASFKSNDYQAALLGYKTALDLMPSENYPKTKITELEKLLSDKTSQQSAYDIAIKSGDQSLDEKKYDLALSHYRKAISLLPGEKYPSKKIEEITAIIENQKKSDESYRLSITEADKQFNENKFEDAISEYTKALTFKPDEAYPQQQITEARGKLTKIKDKEANYANAIASGDRLLSELRYNEALSAYNQALSIKPGETYPISKTAEVNAMLAKQKSDSDKYTEVITKADKAMAAANYSLALTSYTEAAELRKNEKYPQDQIAKINKIIADTHSIDDNYTLAIAEGDKLFGIKDYAAAVSAFTKAIGLKPDETYPKQRITEINKIMDEIASARSSEYIKALETADKLYNKKIFDQAIDAYEAAAKLNPGDAYPELQINKIRKYMSDHAILNLFSESQLISAGNEKKFTFAAIDPSLRKNNYILLKARSTGKNAPKVYLNYGKDNQKNGGIVLRNLDKSTISDLLISISIQDKWFREENNWISISVETGEIEITQVQIAAGE